MKDETKNKVEEPTAEYATKRIKFFKSFEEENEYNHRQLAGMSYEERLTNLEERRKRFFYTLLLPDGNWAPLSRKFEIINLDYEVCQ